jgi:hypothetical protein
MMNDKQIIELGSPILEELIMHLIQLQSGFNPCQIALSVYYPTKDNGKYLIFSSDIFPILNFLHPLMHSQNYSDGYKDIVEKEIRELRDIPKRFSDLKAEHLSGLRFSDNQLVKNSYDALRTIVFEGPLIMGGFFKQCLKSSSPSESDSLSFYGVLENQTKTSRRWELGCRLEKALFLASICSNYTCTFFNLDEGDVDQVLCMSLFCKPGNQRVTATSVLNFLRSKPEVQLLDQMIEQYENATPSITAHVDDWSEPIVKFQKFLAEQQNLHAADKVERARDEIIVQLKAIIVTLTRYSESALTSELAPQLLIVNDFLQNKTAIRGTRSWLHMLKTLEGELQT